MTKVHIVFGSTGEWSDRTEWPVYAFETYDAAESYVFELEGVYKTFQRDACGYQRPPEEARQLALVVRALDPNFEEDYTGAHWRIQSVDYFAGDTDK